MTRLRGHLIRVGVLVLLLLAARGAGAQTTFTVANESQLLAAISTARPGDTIQFAANITLTANLPWITTDLVINGGGFTLSGGGQYRGLVVGDVSGTSTPPPVSVTIQNLTLANTVASGGDGGSSIDGGGGGGGGVGGALLVANFSTVTLSGVTIVSSTASGGDGGGTAGPGGGGTGGTGIGAFAVGGRGGPRPAPGGYGGGGGGTIVGNAGGGSAFGGGTGSTSGGGGGGAGLGGAIFVQGGGIINVSGPLTINGNTVTPGRATNGATDGSAYGSGIFLAGFGGLTFSPAAGQLVIIGDTIADAEGATGVSDAGNWSLFKDGGGTLVLSGANQYSGGTYVSAGTVRVSSDANLGAPGRQVQLYGTSTLAITGSDTFARPLFLDGTPTVSVASGVAATWSGTISDIETVGTLRVNGGGSLYLTNPRNGYSGGTVITGGSRVFVASDGALGSVATLTLGDALSSGTLGVTPGTSIFSSRDVSLGAGGGFFDVQGTSVLTLQGAVSGAGGLTKEGTGTLVLASATSHTGGTNITGGTLQAGLANVLIPTSALTVGAAGTFDTSSLNQTVGSLGGAGRVLLGSGTLTTGGSNASTTFAGIISGTGSLVKVGAGALTLTGANTYTGGTTVSQGTLVGTTTSLQGNIQNNGAVVFDQGASGTYAGIMNGTGSLTKSGSGAVTLLGANTYTGGTTIAAGTLVGTTTSLQGSITNNGVLAFNQDGAGTFNGSIGGSGSLLKQGAGTVTFVSLGTYTGGTTISDGVLRAGAPSVFSPAGAVTIGAAGTLDLNGFSHTLNALSGSGSIALGNATLTTGTDGGSSTFGGVISGTGSLVKDGSGTLTLTGANTYSGGTTVSGGVLVGNTVSLPGDILNNARVVFDQGFDGTYAGSMDGSGIFEKAGGGTLTLTGAHTHTGGTVVSGGSMVGSTANIRGFVLNNGSLVFGGGADGIFSGTLAGTGSLTKTGTGTMTLNGSHGMSGLTTVAQGALVLNGTLGGSVTVAPGALFRASGTVLGNLDLSGTLRVPSPTTGLAPSATTAATGDRLNTPTALTIGGNFTAGTDSVVELPIGPGSNPTILVGGVASLNGTRLDATPIELGTQRNQSFLALTAGDGLTVTNATVTTASPLLISSLVQDGTSLFVSLLNLDVPLASAAGPNFSSVGSALDRMKDDLSGDRGFVIRELLALTDDELEDAMRAIAGELHASNLHLSIRSSEVFTDLIRSEMTEREHEADDGERGWGGERVRWFGQFARERATFAPKNGALGGTADLSDGAGGFELKLSDRFLVGGGGGFGFGSMGLDGLNADSDYSAPRAFGVVGFKPKAFSLRGGGSLSRSKSKSKRRIFIIATLPAALGGLPLSGGIDREAQAEEVTVQNDQWSEYADHEDFGTYRLDYMFGIRRARFARDGFTEAGAGALSLHSDGATINLTDTDVKIHLWRRKGSIRPYVETLVRRSSGFQYTLPMEFAADGDSDFEAAGLPLGQNAFASRVGVTFVRRIGSLTFEYRFRKASGQTVQSGDLRFRF